MTRGDRKVREAGDRFVSAQNSLGVAHPDTLSAQKSLGIAYLENGDPNTAKRIIGCVLGKLESSSDDGWTWDTADAAYGLAQALFKLGELTEAKEIQTKVLQYFVNEWGSGSYEAVLSLWDLGVTLYTLREYAALREIGEPIIEAALESESDPSSQMVRAMGGVANLWTRIGEVKVSSRLYKRIISVCLRHRRDFRMMLSAILAENTAVPLGLYGLKRYPDFGKANRDAAAQGH
jgi:tetratricopeptide (TPR) repeat protein